MYRQTYYQLGLPPLAARSRDGVVAVRRAIRRLREDGFLLPPMRPPRTPPGTRAMDERVAAGNRAEARLRIHHIDAETARGVWEVDWWDRGGPPDRPFPLGAGAAERALQVVPEP